MLFKDKIITKFPDLFTKSNVYNYSIQSLTIIVNLLLMPMLFNVLDKTRFGIWQTMLSFIGYVALLNFGMGNGLRNTISKSYAENNFEAIGNLTGQTIIKLGKIVTIFAIFALPAYYYFFNASLIFKNIGVIEFEVKKAIFIYLIFFLLNIIFSLASSVSYGINKSYLPGFVNLFFLVFVYFTLYVLKQTQTEINLIIVASIFGFTQLFFNILYLFFQFKKFNIKLSFNKKYDLKETTSLSSRFFFVELLSILFLTLDNVIVSNLLGPEKTAEYAVISKMFFTIITFYSILLISFWNGVTIAYVQKNIDWIKKNLKLLFILSWGVLLVGIGISIFNKQLITLWFGKNNTLHLETLSFFLFTIYTFFHCINAILINFQNGLGAVRIQIISTIVMLVIFIGGSYTLDVARYGYNFIIIIKSVAVLVAIIINSFILKKVF